MKMPDVNFIRFGVLEERYGVPSCPYLVGVKKIGPVGMKCKGLLSVCFRSGIPPEINSKWGDTRKVEESSLRWEPVAGSLSPWPAGTAGPTRR